MDFLNHINKIEQVQEDCFFVTLDVASLYTNIPQNEALEIIQETLDSWEFLQLPTNFLCHIAELCLQKNFFQFSDEYFWQISGIAMGCKFAPELANLFTERFEKKHILSSIYKQHIIIYKR